MGHCKFIGVLPVQKDLASDLGYQRKDCGFVCQPLYTLCPVQSERRRSFRKGFEFGCVHLKAQYGVYWKMRPLLQTGAVCGAVLKFPAESVCRYCTARYQCTHCPDRQHESESGKISVRSERRSHVQIYSPPKAEFNF